MAQRALIVVGLWGLAVGAQALWVGHAFGSDSTVSHPSAASGLKIGWVDHDKLFKEYERTKSSKLKLEAYSKEMRLKRERLVSEIKNLREELALLNEESRAERRNQMEEKLKALAAFDRQTKESLRDKEEEQLGVILEEIERVSRSFAERNGFALLLTDRAVLYGDQAIDVTDEILALLNERYNQNP